MRDRHARRCQRRRPTRLDNRLLTAEPPAPIRLRGGTRGTRAAATDAVAHVNDDPGDEIFLEVERISSGATAVAYGVHNERLVTAGVRLEYGGDSATETDFNCLPGNPPRLIQRAYELMGPTIYGWRQETNVVYAWQGPKLVQGSKGTFKRRGAVARSRVR